MFILKKNSESGIFTSITRKVNLNKQSILNI